MERLTEWQLSAIERLLAEMPEGKWVNHDDEYIYLHGTEGRITEIGRVAGFEAAELICELHNNCQALLAMVRDGLERDALREQLAEARVEAAALRSVVRDLIGDLASSCLSRGWSVGPAEKVGPHYGPLEQRHIDAANRLLADPSPVVAYLLAAKAVMEHLDSSDIEIVYETFEQREEAMKLWAVYRTAKATLEGTGDV